MEMPGKIVQPHSTGLTGTRRMSEWVHADLVCTPSRMESTAVVAISETWNVLCQNTQQFSVEGFCILIWSPNSTELRTVVQVCGREGEKSRASWWCVFGDIQFQLQWERRERGWHLADSWWFFQGCETSRRSAKRISCFDERLLPKLTHWVESAIFTSTCSNLRSGYRTT
jgi:hypothetical protein